MPQILELKTLGNENEPRLQWPVVTDEPVKRSKPAQNKPHKPVIQSPFVRCMEARAMIGGRSLLERAERAGWIKPVCRGKRMTLFKRQDVEACIARIGWGELP